MRLFIHVGLAAITLLFLVASAAAQSVYCGFMHTSCLSKGVSAARCGQWYAYAKKYGIWPPYDRFSAQACIRDDGGLVANNPPPFAFRPAAGPRIQTWKGANGKTVKIKVPKTHAECMNNNRILKYPPAQAKNHCDKKFSSG